MWRYGFHSGLVLLIWFLFLQPKGKWLCIFSPPWSELNQRVLHSTAEQIHSSPYHSQQDKNNNSIWFELMRKKWANYVTLYIACRAMLWFEVEFEFEYEPERKHKKRLFSKYYKKWKKENKKRKTEEKMNMKNENMTGIKKNYVFSAKLWIGGSAGWWKVKEIVCEMNNGKRILCISLFLYSFSSANSNCTKPVH